MIHQLILKISQNIINELSDDIDNGSYSNDDSIALSAHLDDLITIAKEGHDKNALIIIKRANDEAYYDNIDTVIKTLKQLF